MLSLRKELQEFVDSCKPDPTQTVEQHATKIAREGADVVIAIYVGLDSIDREKDLPAFKAEVSYAISEIADKVLVDAPMWATLTLKSMAPVIGEGLVNAAVEYAGPVENFYTEQVCPRAQALGNFCDLLVAAGAGTI